MLQQIDELDVASREFYERAKLKLSFSLFLAALGMMFLALGSQTGGNSNGNSWFAEQSGITDDQKNIYNAKTSGYGFACFTHICAFILSISAAIYISPLVRSPNEKLVVNSPQNIRFTDGPISNETYGTRPSEPVVSRVTSAPPQNQQPRSEHLSKFATVNPNV